MVSVCWYQAGGENCSAKVVVGGSYISELLNQLDNINNTSNFFLLKTEINKFFKAIV